MDLLKTAKHGSGTNVYLVRFHWIGLSLNLPRTPWPTIELALREAYVLVAPKSLSASL